MRNFTILNIVFLVAFSFSGVANAQLVISSPNIGFSQACASPSFNTYNVTFSFTESAVNSSNQFIIELSDKLGDFSSSTTIYSSAQGSVTTSPATLTFSLPTTIAGEAYKIKIKSTSPVASSSGSIAFPAYYKIQDTPFSINNLISTAVFCSGGSYLLSIDNPGDDLNDSPLQYPSLTFNWYKETGPTTSVFVDSGETLSVSQPGTYFVETNYGSCTSNSFSNRVVVSQASSQLSSEISSSRGNPYCSTEGATTLSAIGGVSYQWFKDGEEISGATSQMYDTNESGLYAVNVNLGNCSVSASIDLDNTGFTSTIDVPENNVIDEGETVLATITTDAVNPEYEWFLNDNLISSANSNSYEATQTGNYKVIIKQTVGCESSTEFLFVVSESFPSVANIPNLISPNNDGINDTWIIPQEYVSGTGTKIVLMSAQGEVVLETDNYMNNWPETELNFKGVNPVYYYIITTSNNTIRKGSITVIK